MSFSEKEPLRVSPGVSELIAQDLALLALTKKVDNHGDETRWSRLTPEQRKNAEVLFGDIIVDDFAMTNNILAPTPGDPHKVRTQKGPYTDAAWVYIRDRYDDKAAGNYIYLAQQSIPKPPEVIAARNLTDEQLAQEAFFFSMTEMGLGVIEDELNEGHIRQCSKNTQSMDRMRQSYLRNPSRFTGDELQKIHDIRTGDATSYVRAIILGNHTEIGSIEDMELSAPLDLDLYERGMSQYYESLVELSNSGALSSMTVEPFLQSNVWFENMNGVGPFGLSMAKHVIATARVEQTDLELVLKEKFYRFPTRPQLRKIRSNIKKKGNFQFDFQSVNASSYWRVKKHDMYIPHS